jgi:hypothetical protein
MVRPPLRCPRGHPLRPGRMLVGSIACSCGRHLTWRCECEAVTYGPAHAATVARWWRKVRDKVGIEHRLHDLRHFYASGLIAAGCDVVTVQRALGHSSAAITYSHLWPDANDRTRKAAAGLFAEAIGSTADALRTKGRN